MPRTRNPLAWLVVPSLLFVGVGSGRVEAQASFGASSLDVAPGVRFGERIPLLLRADAPIPPGTPDPSLATAFNSVRDGINLNGVGFIQTPVPGDPRFAFFCTAQRIGPRTIVTAAHCVTDDETGALLSTTSQTAAFFTGPTGRERFNAVNVQVRPDWFGFYNQNTFVAGDVAVINFEDALPSYVTTYDIYTTVLPNGAGFSGLATTHVGFGTYGTGTGATAFDLNRRWGQNYVDFTGSTGDSDQGVLYTNFQDAAGGWSTTCLFMGVCNPTRGGTEAGTAEGDSGGPLFINGQLAAVTSFGTAFCDPSVQDMCVPVTADPSRPDSFGALNGFAPLAPNLDFIRLATIPEPSTVLLVGGGLVTLLGAAWRRGRTGR